MKGPEYQRQEATACTKTGHMGRNLQDAKDWNGGIMTKDRGTTLETTGVTQVCGQRKDE